jgi:hypothetical protein
MEFMEMRWENVNYRIGQWLAVLNINKSHEGTEFMGELSDCQLLNKNSSPRS